MFRNLIVAVLVLFCSSRMASAVELFSDGFDYTIGEKLIDQTNLASGKPWNKPGTPAGEVQVIADPDVNYPGLLTVSADSNSVSMPRPNNANQSYSRINIPGGTYTRGSGATLFYSFTIEMTSWTFFAPPTGNPSDTKNDAGAKNATNRRGGHLGGFHGGDAELEPVGNMSSPGGFAAPLYVRREIDYTQTGTDGTPGTQTDRYELGIAKSLSAGSTDTAVLDTAYDTSQSFEVGDKLLIVGQYDFVDADFSQSPGNDIARLWINPTPGDEGAEASPSWTAPSSTNYPNFGGASLPIWSFYLKADDIAPGNFRVDNVRVGTTFADVIPAAPLTGGDGDFNEDGMVDAADYVAWRKNVPGDYNEGDYQDWVTNFGSDLGDGGSQSVPEPSTLVGMLMAASTVLALRRRL